MQVIVFVQVCKYQLYSHYVNVLYSYSCEMSCAWRVLHHVSPHILFYSCCTVSFMISCCVLHVVEYTAIDWLLFESASFVVVTQWCHGLLNTANCA